MARLRQRTMRQLCRLRTVIRARDTIPANAKHCCSALLPTRVIAGHRAIWAVTVAVDRAPWIRIRRLRIATSRFREQRSGNDKNRNDRRAHHYLPPCCPSWLSFILAGLLRRRNEGKARGGPVAMPTVPARPAASARPGHSAYANCTAFRHWTLDGSIGRAVSRGSDHSACGWGKAWHFHVSWWAGSPRSAM